MNRMQPLSRPELLAVLKIARGNSVRDHALLLLCFAHGMRASECGQLLLSDISTKDWTVRIKRVKGSLETLQILSANSERLLDERRVLSGWAGLRINYSPYLFPARKKSGSLSPGPEDWAFRSYCEQRGETESKTGVPSLQ